MIVFIASGLVIGGLIGARFTVLSLVPAVGLTLTIGMLAWVEQPRTPDWNLLYIIVLIAFLQVGYLCGAGLRLVVVPLRAGEKSREGRALGSH